MSGFWTGEFQWEVGWRRVVFGLLSRSNFNVGKHRPIRFPGRKVSAAFFLLRVATSPISFFLCFPGTQTSLDI